MALRLSAVSESGLEIVGWKFHLWPTILLFQICTADQAVSNNNMQPTILFFSHLDVVGTWCLTTSISSELHD
jgi:hypothetical protein